MKAKNREEEHKDRKEVKYLIQNMWNDHNERFIPGTALPTFLEMKGLCSGFDSLCCPIFHVLFNIGPNIFKHYFLDVMRAHLTVCFLGLTLPWKSIHSVSRIMQSIYLALLSL